MERIRLRLVPIIEAFREIGIRLPTEGLKEDHVICLK